MDGENNPAGNWQQQHPGELEVVPTEPAVADTSLPNFNNLEFEPVLETIRRAVQAKEGETNITGWVGRKTGWIFKSYDLYPEQIAMKLAAFASQSQGELSRRINSKDEAVHLTKAGANVHGALQKFLEAANSKKAAKELFKLLTRASEEYSKFNQIFAQVPDKGQGQQPPAQPPGQPPQEQQAA